MSPVIGVFPASGGLGSSIVHHLQTLVPPSQQVLIARHPEKLAALSQAGVAIRQADYDVLSSLVNVFSGVDVLMLVSYASFEIQHRAEAHKLAIDAAIQSGVKHIFYSSLGFAGDLKDESVAHVMGAHLLTERYLADQSSKITYTSIREGLYSESFPIYTAWLDLKNPVDEITIPHSGDGPGVSWVKKDELGEATAKLVASYTQSPQKFNYINKKLLLSGQREISLAETVEILGRAIGKSLRIKEISVDEYVNLPQIGDKHTYQHVDLSREWSTAWQAIRNGEAAVVSPALKEILGREPETYETTIESLINNI